MKLIDGKYVFDVCDGPHCSEELVSNSNDTIIVLSETQAETDPTEQIFDIMPAKKMEKARQFCCLECAFTWLAETDFDARWP
jgi:hypothetical protein